MFNRKLKNATIEIYDERHKKYDASYKNMQNMCEKLYSTRVEAVKYIKWIQEIINSIANTPKEIDTELGKVDLELIAFKETEKYAEEAQKEVIKAGVNIAEGVIGSVGFAAASPAAMMSIATTFGTASTGTAISALSGAAAEKAAVAWLGRTFAGFAVKEGAGMAAGKAFLALAGPMGIGISAATISVSLARLTKKNKQLSEELVKEAMSLEEARESLDESYIKIKALKDKTGLLLMDIKKQKTDIGQYMNINYCDLSVEEKKFLGTLVNNTLSLSELLNKTIE